MTKLKEFKMPFDMFDKVIFEIDGTKYIGEITNFFEQHSERSSMLDIKISIFSGGITFLRSIDEIIKYEE